ncbi:MAG TPA: Maf family protein [Bryobacteraceae bacterium]|nr:Maf family protein [Bryobacteraceae bacterium]
MLVLASNSPRRRQILTAAGIPFTVRAPQIEEQRRADESPNDYVRRLAEQKAFAVSMAADEVVLAGDTVVVVDEHILEKPRDQADALRMLRLLSGRDHEVITGVCLRSASRTIVDTAATRVHFVELSDAEMDAYVASGEPMDKAGAYAIQGLASRFIDRVDGGYFNVVGLPIALVYRYLKELGCV